MTHIEVGTLLKPRELVTIHAERICLPDREKIIHLQFRRFAGCPVCDLHLHSMVKRHHEIEAVSIREVVVFHAPAEELLKYTGTLPFAMIPDPAKVLYAEFGVGSAPAALLDPRAWLPIVRGVARSTRAVFHKTPIPPLDPPGGRWGLPADFLIGTDGRVLSRKYGAHAYDQWSVDELLALAGAMAVSPGKLSPSAPGARRMPAGDPR